MARYLTRHYGERSFPDFKKTLVIGFLAFIAVVIIVVIYIFTSGQDKEQISESSVEAEEVTEVTEPLSVEFIQEDSLTAPELQLQPILSEETTAPIEESNSQIAVAIAEAISLINSEPPSIIRARETLNDVLHKPMSDEQRETVKKLLSDLSQVWLFSKTVYQGDSLCEYYEVKPGDLLSTIGRGCKVPWEILQQINNISKPEALQAGQTIKVINGPFNARIYRSSFSMDLYLNDTFVRSFPVGLGKPGHETPTGLWVVEPGQKMIKPVWRDPETGKLHKPEDPDYPLGSRWIRLQGLEGEAIGRTGIAFHGTNDPNLIGVAGSRGCIRLHNGDAILIYDLMMPDFSRVEVVD